MLEETLESPLDCKEVQPVHPKGNQSWISIGKTDAEAEAWIIWPSDAGKDWRQEKKGVTEDEMIGWHHQLNGHEFEQTPGNREQLRSLACYSTWGQSQTQLCNWTTTITCVYSCTYVYVCVYIHTHIYGVPDGSDGKEFTCSAGESGSTPGLERSPRGRYGDPLQYSCLENPHEKRSLAGYIQSMELQKVGHN